MCRRRRPIPVGVSVGKERDAGSCRRATAGPDRPRLGRPRRWNRGGLFPPKCSVPAGSVLQLGYLLQHCCAEKSHIFPLASTTLVLSLFVASTVFGPAQALELGVDKPACASAKPASSCIFMRCCITAVCCHSLPLMHEAIDISRLRLLKQGTSVTGHGAKPSCFFEGAV